MRTETKLSPKAKIAYDLTISPYKSKINYSPGRSIRFIFSSDLYKTKFESRLFENRKMINESLSKRFGFEIRNDVLCDIKLYSSIEKRGFLVKINKERFTCLESLELDGKNLIAKS